MKTKHTPGPWSFERYDSEPPFGKYIVNSQGLRSIAVTTGGSLSEIAQENEANAKLIASAPDLLEACKIALKEFDKMGCEHYDEKGHPDCPLCACKLAIAKATGDA